MRAVPWSTPDGVYCVATQANDNVFEELSTPNGVYCVAMGEFLRHAEVYYSWSCPGGVYCVASGVDGVIRRRFGDVVNS